MKKKKKKKNERRRRERSRGRRRRRDFHLLREDEEEVFIHCYVFYLPNRSASQNRFSAKDANALGGYSNFYFM
jgi:hypothetical protein